MSRIVTNANIVKVHFHDDVIDVIERDGKRVVVLRRLCENLGLNEEAQRKRLTNPERCPWATTSIMEVVAEDGKVRDQVCLDFDDVPMFFATITMKRVREDLRPKLVLYQKECASVLRNHFFGRVHQSEVKELPREWSLRLSRSFEAHNRFINARWPGAFSILTAISTPMMTMEDVLLEHLLPLSERDLPDGSVSSYWNRYRRELGLPEFVKQAPLYLPDRQITVNVKVYPAEELAMFNTWFYRVYLPKHAPEYLKNKFKEYTMPALSAADNACRRICDRRAALPESTLGLIDAAGGVIKAQQLLPGIN